MRFLSRQNVDILIGLPLPRGYPSAPRVPCGDPALQIRRCLPIKPHFTAPPGALLAPPNLYHLKIHFDRGQLSPAKGARPRWRRLDLP